MIKTQTLKGFRDFLPHQARKREYVIAKIKKSFGLFGFEPLETPALEYESILAGKYGDEGDKLMYRFEDNGQRKVALRYDQTVPLARVASQYRNELIFPFKRYQIQPVWRAENTQKGRFREFLQCDADIAGGNSLLSDAEVIATAVHALESLGIKDYTILINHRETFNKLAQSKDYPFSQKQITAIIRTIDKIDKVGTEGVLIELKSQGFSEDEITYIFASLSEQKQIDALAEITSHLEHIGIKNYQYSPHLARGLDYYTGLIFEIVIPGYTAGSIAGGGRYDNLIGMFAEKNIPAVGFSFGFDRLMEAMDELNLFPEELALSATQVLVTIFNSELARTSLEITSLLRSQNIHAQVYLGEIKNKNPLEKQIKYAVQKKIPYVVIIGPEEAERKTVTVKNLANHEQQIVTYDQLLTLLK